jgi:hypothetical protein
MMTIIYDHHIFIVQATDVSMQLDNIDMLTNVYIFKSFQSMESNFF